MFGKFIELNNASDNMPSLSLKKKIGSLFVCGFAGNDLHQSHPLISHIEELGLGGVILFDRLLAQKQKENNITGPAQLSRLTADLQACAGDNLLICVDQEGGRVSRFREEFGFPVTAPAAELAEKPEQVKKAAAQTAKMLQSCGINWNLAPVVDVNLFPENPIIGKFGRSFGDSFETVIQHARTWITEHRCQNIITCLKHFPGHGSSRADSHLGFVDITTSWQELELEPYRQLIEDGFADAVMIGHLFHQHLDPRYPATLSEEVIKGILREKLDYAGIVISDDMQMGAITSKYGLGEACVRALQAGIDMLILGNNLEHDAQLFRKIQEVVLKAVAEGQLSEYRIEEAWQRVVQLKQKLRKQTI